MDVVKLNIEPGHLWAAGIIWPIVCTVVVGARFATRRAYSRLGWDDWLSLPALVGLYGLSAAVIYGVATKSLGYPDKNYNFNYVEYQSRALTINRKVYWSSGVVLAATLGFIKLSCLAFYHRAFRTGVHRVAEVILWSLMVITIIWGISFTVANLLFCGNLSHLEWLWSRGGDYLKCTTDTYMLQQSFAISDVVTDALIVLYPLPFVARLQISLARKVAIAFIFLLGSATLAMSAVRLEVLLQAVKVTKELVVGNPDVGPGDILTATTYFMIMEAGFGLCAICLPTLSSSMKIPGVQTFFQNVSKIFSVRSNTSVTSEGSGDKNHAVREKPSRSLERAHSNEIEIQTA